MYDYTSVYNEIKSDSIICLVFFMNNKIVLSEGMDHEYEVLMILHHPLLWMVIESIGACMSTYTRWLVDTIAYQSQHIMKY